MRKVEPVRGSRVRVAAVALAVVLLSCVYAFLIPGPNLGTDSWLAARNSDTGSARRGQEQGRQAAERDLARGTPRIRRAVATLGDLAEDGVGIDRVTGLPLDNTGLMCATGVDFVAYRFENESYNERIMEAYRKGDLTSLSLAHKIRTGSATRALIADTRPMRLAKDGDRAEPPDGECALTLGDFDRVTLTRTGGDSRRLLLAYPDNFRHGARSRAFAPGPFDVWFADKGTTAVLRDADGYAWIIDLPRRIVVQVVDTNP